MKLNWNGITAIDVKEAIRTFDASSDSHPLARNTFTEDKLLVQPSADGLDDAMVEIFKSMEIKTGFSAYWVIQQLQNIMTPYYVQFINEETRLKAALTMIKFYQDHLADKIIARDPHELRLAHETKNMLLGAEMMLVSSLERRESRGMHYREDYSKRDDKNFFAYLRLQKNGDDMRVVKIELPFEWLCSPFQIQIFPRSKTSAHFRRWLNWTLLNPQ